MTPHTTINVPIKTCRNCGEVFIIGYHASVGIQFWLTFLTGLIGGIVYWAVRGRRERCPICKSKDIDVREYKEIEVSKTEGSEKGCTSLGVVI
ncbi:MAG: hypothetical protein ACRD8W_10810 [Nitrososphaeraceae archaeon]